MVAMLFATGGLAYGHVGYNLSAIETGGVRSVSDDAERERDEIRLRRRRWCRVRFAPNLILKGEYQYINLGTIGATAPVTTIAGGVPTGETATLKAIDAAFHTIRLGLNWKL